MHDLATLIALNASPSLARRGANATVSLGAAKSRPKAPPADLRVSGSGTVYLLHALTSAGREWVALSIDPEAQTFGGGIVVEHRYISDVVSGARADGLSVVA